MQLPYILPNVNAIIEYLVQENTQIGPSVNPEQIQTKKQNTTMIRELNVCQSELQTQLIDPEREKIYHKIVKFVSKKQKSLIDSLTMSQFEPQNQRVHFKEQTPVKIPEPEPQKFQIPSKSVPLQPVQQPTQSKSVPPQFQPTQPVISMPSRQSSQPPQPQPPIQLKTDPVVIELQQQITRLTQTNQNVQNQNIQLLKEQTDMQSEIVALREQNENLQNQLQMHKDQLAQIERENTDLFRQSGKKLQNFNRVAQIQDKIQRKLEEMAEIDQHRVASIPVCVQELSLKAIQLKQELMQQYKSGLVDRISYKYQSKLDQYEKMLQTQNSPTVKKANELGLTQTQRKQVQQSLSKTGGKTIDILQIEVVKLCQKFGAKAPQLQKLPEQNKWCVERTGAVLTLELNQRGVVVVIDDSGVEVNKVPLTIYLKGIMNGNKVGGLSASRSGSRSGSRNGSFFGNE
ncbi:Conserved_hypothetical protein [Hexamita inflata]|uniref:Uncharacterized protein n=1 Tax=Hexamita inflata TaxID=28002 RepID=A0AA86PMB9_9EUKA|nr:Conserved hypothetical protein [Hexamita inflata]